MRQPRHLGRPDGTTHEGSVGNPACGDVLTLHLRIEAGRIQAAGFDSMGSAYGLAVADVLCDHLHGVPADDLPDATRLLALLPDLAQRHRYLARLAVDALQAALHPRPAREVPEGIDLDGARSFIRRILGNGQAWSTPQVVAMAEAEALELPDAPARLLAQMAKDGVLRGEMDVDARQMVWRLA